ELRHAELNRQPPADEPRRGARPRPQRAERDRGLVRPPVVALGVQLANAGEVGGYDFHAEEVRRLIALRKRGKDKRSGRGTGTHAGTTTPTALFYARHRERH